MRQRSWCCGTGAAGRWQTSWARTAFGSLHSGMPEAYEGCYDGAELDAYIEEICADTYAGMDRLLPEKARIVQQAEENGGTRGRESTEAQSAEKSAGETRGPPEK